MSETMMALVGPDMYQWPCEPTATVGKQFVYAARTIRFHNRPNTTNISCRATYSNLIWLVIAEFVIDGGVGLGSCAVLASVIILAK